MTLTNWVSGAWDVYLGLLGVTIIVFCTSYLVGLTIPDVHQGFHPLVQIPMAVSLPVLIILIMWGLGGLIISSHPDPQTTLNDFSGGGD